MVVTGGNGFLGSHLVARLLSQGALVTVLDVVERPVVTLSEAEGRVEFVRGSITDPALVAETLRGADTVIHLAAIANPRTCEEQPDLAETVNVGGTRTLLEATPDGARFIFLSSAAVYGQPQFVPITEDHALLGKDRYAVTKRRGEELCRLHAARLHLTIVRNFNTFGPGQTADYLIPKIILQGLRERRIEVWSTTPIRDFMFVRDTISALTDLACLDGGSPGLLNLGSGEGHSVAEVLAILGPVLGGIQVTSLEKPVLGSPVLVADNFKARTSLHWRPQVPLSQGLGETVDWYRHHLS